MTGHSESYRSNRSMYSIAAHQQRRDGRWCRKRTTSILHTTSNGAVRAESESVRCGEEPERICNVSDRCPCSIIARLTKQAARKGSVGMA